MFRVHQEAEEVERMANRVGRPYKEINQTEFEKLCGIQCTEKEIEAWFGVTDKTLDGWCVRTYDRKFSDIYKEKAEAGKISLRRKQWHLADKSASMAIFLGKNYLGQTDKIEQTVVGNDAPKTLNVNFVSAKKDDQ
jgi:hypothetical protein